MTTAPAGGGRRERDLPTDEALAERAADHDAYIRKNAAAAAGPTLIT